MRASRLQLTMIQPGTKLTQRLEANQLLNQASNYSTIRTRWRSAVTCAVARSHVMTVKTVSVSRSSKLGLSLEAFNTNSKQLFEEIDSFWRHSVYILNCTYI